ncbi:13538_t:CDS:2, partial [Dentiscutata erythropus]
MREEAIEAISSTKKTQLQDPLAKKKGKEREELEGFSSIEAKRKKEDQGLIGKEERKPKVNRALVQRTSGNTVKSAKHSSQPLIALKGTKDTLNNHSGSQKGKERELLGEGPERRL